MIRLKSEDQQVVELQQFLLDSSITVYVGDAVAFSTSTAGVVTNAPSAVAGTGYVVGVVAAIVDKDGNPFVSSSGAELTSVVTPASNTTYYVKVIPAYPEFTFVFDVNATLGTTTNSDKVGVEFNLADARTIAENSVILMGGTGYPKQVLSLGPAIDENTGAVSTNKIVGKFVRSVWN
jgi:hypothetical protein